jgi:hypothetical protein
MSILNTVGHVVWNNCYASGQPGACPMYMMLHSIDTRGIYRIIKTWNQRSGARDDFVSRGTYVLWSNFSGSGKTQRASFQLIE